MNQDSNLDLLTRGTLEIISFNELKTKLSSNKKLRIKFGADPTASDLHLGHTLPLTKLKHFQDLGHEIIFIIGDFTASIGDPSGRSILRKPLTKDEIERNAETYTAQVFKILDKNKTQVVFNSEWLSKLGIEGLLNLASKYTVARMLERDDFHKRYSSNSPISIIEFLYPLIQGYDSVHLKADVEIGGSDQKFNLLVGRDLQKDFGQEPQVVMTVPILEGLDGVKKMSKSYGNYVGISEEPKEIFGKIMSISDELMMKYYELLTLENLGELKTKHPKILKENLAEILITRFYDEEKANLAKLEFNKIFKEKELPDNIDEFFATKNLQGLSAQDLLFETKLASSKAEAKRMIDQGAVKINSQKCENFKEKIILTHGMIIQFGKRKFLKISMGTKNT